MSEPRYCPIREHYCTCEERCDDELWDDSPQAMARTTQLEETMLSIMKEIEEDIPLAADEIPVSLLKHPRKERPQ